MAKHIEPADIVVVRPPGVMMSPPDNSPPGAGDDNNAYDSGQHDGWFGDDSDRP